MNKKKKKIVILLDYREGPIWGMRSFPDKTGIEAIDNDRELTALNTEIGEMFDSYYAFDVGNQPCVFDDEQERKDKGKMIGLITRLKKRLNEVNDGSFEIEDRETERIMAL